VPAYRTHSVVDIYHGTDPGLAVNDRALYRLPWHLVFCYAIATPAIGAAAGALEAFISNNQARVSANGGPPVALNPSLHRRLAQSWTEVDMMRARVGATWRTFLAKTEAGEDIPYVERAQCKYEGAHALNLCPRAVYEVLEMNGARTMHANTPLQRFYRDLLAMRNHPAASIESAATLYAGARLGLQRPAFNPAQRLVL